MIVPTNSGLSYRKLDLHVHTPASKCFSDKKVTPSDLVNQALKEKLDAIAITDHNSGSWIDRVKEEAKGKLVVFPGVEISSTGGEKGVVHIIALLDISCSTKDIENLLGDLKIQADKYGAEEAFTVLSPSQVIDTITTHKGLAILAHSNSTHGVMSDMKGNPRTDIINNINLSAVEVTQSDFLNEDRKAKKIRVCDLLSGSNPSYNKVAIYQASDNLEPNGEGHCVHTMASIFTYFKLDEITLEGLRQCFCDPDVRIKLAGDFLIKQCPSITSMSVSRGFLNNQRICFHQGLNSIVGGKGSGKSLIVEFLRFCLNQSSLIKNIAEDANEKLLKRLEPFGKITIELSLPSGDTYQVTRTYDKASNTIECTNLKDGTVYQGDIPTLFPILAYSQNEVIKIAEDENSQLNLIDTFIDSSQYFDEIHKITTDLVQSDKEMAKSIKAAADVAAIQKELSTVLERIKIIDASLNNALFAEIKSYEKKKVAFDKQIGFHNLLCSKTDLIINEAKISFVSPLIEEELKDDQDLLAGKKSSEESIKLFVDSLNDLKEKINQKRKSLETQLNTWLPKYQEKRKQYEEMLAQTGSNQGKLEIERTRLGSKKTELEGELASHLVQLEKLGKIKADRAALITKLYKVKKDHFELRKNKYDDLTGQSKGRLQLTISYASNKEKFKGELAGLLKGSGIRKEVSEKISRNLMPSEFIDLLVENDITSLSSKGEIDEVNAKKIIDTLNSKEALDDVFVISHSCFPEDVPSIEFKKEDDNYYPLSELSVGQKCSALLIIALSEGVRPIIVDQPEDSLDISSVFEDIVSKLRDCKEKRQFILTTHNSSVGVASDSDNFIVLRSNATQGSIRCIGAIDRVGVKKEIIDHLEGGPEPYNLRNRKYNIRKSISKP